MMNTMYRKIGTGILLSIIIILIFTSMPPKYSTGQSVTLKNIGIEVKPKSDSIVITKFQESQNKVIDKIKDRLDAAKEGLKNEAVYQQNVKLLSTVKRLNSINNKLLKNIQQFEIYLQAQLLEDKAVEDSMFSMVQFDCSTCPIKDSIRIIHDTIEKRLRRKWLLFGKYVSVQ